MTDSESPGKKRLLDRLGAGLIAGAADDDPSGIATYSQVGAAYGYGTLWTILIALPLMIAIQTICARIGRVTGEGLGANIRSQCPFPLAIGLVVLLFVANIINLSADIGAMGAALKLLIGGAAFLYATGFAAVSVLLQVWVPFNWYSPFLKLLTLSLFAYVATVFVINVPWLVVARNTFLPHVTFSASYAVAIVAVLGTTISPYLFFWQASQEANEVRVTLGRKPLRRASQQGPAALRRINLDTDIGMVFSEIVAFFIILTAAVVLHANGKIDIQTSAEAAAALRPLAGPFAFGLFAAGIVGTGLLALPVLAGSAAYALGETLRWRTGMETTLSKGRLFYGTIALATLVGMLLSFSPIDPVKMLFWSAVVNGVAAVPLMVVIMCLATRRKVMGKFTIPRVLKWLGWPQWRWRRPRSSCSPRGGGDGAGQRVCRPRLIHRHRIHQSGSRPSLWFHAWAWIATARGMLVSSDTDVPRVFQAWLERKRQDEYAHIIFDLSDLEFAVVVWLATSGEASVYSKEARKAMEDLMKSPCSPQSSEVQTAVRRLTGAGIVDPTGAKGSYELADQGFQIVLHEPASA